VINYKLTIKSAVIPVLITLTSNKIVFFRLLFHAEILSA